MRGTHAWTFKLLDARRKDMVGTDEETVTRVPSFPTSSVGSCFLKIRAAAVVVEDEVAEKGEDTAEAPELSISTSSSMPIETMDFMWLASHVLLVSSRIPCALRAALK